MTPLPISSNEQYISLYGCHQLLYFCTKHQGPKPGGGGIQSDTIFLGKLDIHNVLCFDPSWISVNSWSIQWELCHLFPEPFFATELQITLRLRFQIAHRHLAGAHLQRCRQLKFLFTNNPTRCLLKRFRLSTLLRTQTSTTRATIC